LFEQFFLHLRKNELEQLEATIPSKKFKTFLLISTPSHNVGHRGKGQQLVEQHRTVFLLCRSCKSTGNCRGKKDQIRHDVEDDAPREGAVQTLDGD